jgi:hypothetical protein
MSKIMQLSQIFQNLGLAGAMAELATLLLVIFASSAVFWLLIGRFRLHNFLINTYISFALAQVIPKDIMSFNKYSYLLLFLILIVLLTLINKYLFDIHQYGSGLALWQVLVMSFLEIMLLLSIIFYLLPTSEILQYISKNYLIYFLDPLYRVLWMAMPLLFLVVVKKRNR